jgi:hypothetical protein
MVYDPDFSLQRKKEEIERVEMKIRYNSEDKSIVIGTMDGFYNIQVKSPANAENNISDIEKRAREVGEFVKNYFIEHPEELHKLGYPLRVAMVNSTGTAVAFNINYVAMGKGSIKNPIKINNAP